MNNLCCGEIINISSMRNVNRLKDKEMNSPLTPEEISKLRMEHARNNPELIVKIVNGDAAALEEFTNFGGIQGKVTQVIIREKS